MPLLLDTAMCGQQHPTEDTMKYLQEPIFEADPSQSIRRLAAGYTPPTIVEIYNSDDPDEGGALAIDTYKWEVPNMVNFDHFSLGINISAGIEIKFYGTTFIDLPGDDFSEWEDVSEWVLGEGVLSVVGPHKKTYHQPDQVRTRLGLEVVVTAAINTCRIQVIQQ